MSSRVGRPRRDTLEGRRRQVLQAAQEVITEHGFERATMLQIAERCGASKETLYSWFGSKEGLFAELVIAAGQQTVTRLTPVLRGTDDRALRSFARALLGLLVSPWSVAVNRAAMSSDALARLVLAHGRHRIGPVVEAYLADLDRAGVLHVPDPKSAFTELYGLVVRDTQIRVLLGEPAPSAAAQRRQADAGVDRFWQAYIGGLEAGRQALSAHVGALERIAASGTTSTWREPRDERAARPLVCEMHTLL